MPPDLIVVRHGETDWNAAGRLQGQTDIPLNARGRDQADAVGRGLKKAFPEIADRAFIASPLSRAVETMRRLRVALGLAPDAFSVDARLKELSFGAWEGSTLDEIGARDPDALRARDGDRWGFRPPDGENYADLETRVRTLVDDLAEPAVLVAHGGVARVLLGLLGGMERAKLPDVRIAQGRALAFSDGRWRWV